MGEEGDGVGDDREEGEMRKMWMGWGGREGKKQYNRDISLH